MTPFGRKLACRLPCLALLLCAGFAARAAPAPAGVQSVWELTPYRIQLMVATEPIARLPSGLRDELQAELIARIESVVGAPWDITHADPPKPLLRLIASDIKAVTVESLPEESLEFDKVMLLAVTGGPSGYRVSARELDVRTRVFGTTVRLPAWQAEKLRDVAFQAIRKAFAPLARIEKTDGDVVKLSLRAAGLRSRDKTLAWVSPGSVFRPLVRYNDRHGNIRRITNIPWTFLVVDKLDDGIRCKLYSGLRSPLSGRRRGRIEQLALAVVPPHASTKLTLRCRTDPKQTLSGYNVYISPPGSKAKRLLGRTNFQGEITVPPSASSDDALSILTVSSGGRPLARLPIVPGLEPRLTASVVNDDQRLEAEGFVTGLREMLVDLVARREVLIAMAEQQLDEGQLDGQFDEANGSIRQLRELRTGEQFARMLDSQQKKFFSKDPTVQRRIDALFAETQKQLNEYLDPAAIDRLSRRLLKAGSAK